MGGLCDCERVAQSSHAKTDLDQRYTIQGVEASRRETMPFGVKYTNMSTKRNIRETDINIQVRERQNVLALDLSPLESHTALHRLAKEAFSGGKLKV